MSASDQRRERQKAAKRHAITLTAVRLVLDKGLDAMTVEAISEAADISPRTFFNYFSTKDEALQMRPSWSSESLTALFEARPADEPVFRSMRVVAQEIADSFVPAREESELWRELWRRHPELLAKRGSGGEEEMFRSLILAVAERVGADPMKDSYPSVVVTSAFSVIQWAVRFSWINQDGRTTANLIDEAFDLLEIGL
ncbi:DNA-binding protein AcrR family [Kitasatospora sp. Ki12]|uniref:TetR/AcrR family transcriptional regulator n=1 Tax=Kitasatospora xanthocidica TaxID=83382 RepID=UPI001672D6AC|nr:TetR/AcrR family transcriptional regulator [Kitasatospora xanthocidica]